MPPKKPTAKQTIAPPTKPIVHESESDETSTTSEEESVYDDVNPHIDDDGDTDDIIDDDEIPDDIVAEKNDDVEIIDNDDCVQLYSKKNDDDDNIDVDIDEMIFDNLDDDVDTVKKNSIFITDSERITRNVLTEFEYVRLLCVRATQIAYGAESTITGTSNMDPKLIAQKELDAGLIPLFVIRRLPDGTKEKINPNLIYKKLIV